MAEKGKIGIRFDTVEVVDLESGEVVHDEEIATRGLRIVSEAVEKAEGIVSIPEEGLRWRDEDQE